MAVSRALGVSRSNLYEQRNQKPRKERVVTDDAWLLPKVEKLVNQRPTYGYRRITALLRRDLLLEGKPVVNPKRVYRIMKKNGLLLQRYNPRPSRTHDGKIMTLKSDLRWCSDAFGIQCWNGEQLQVAFVLDCHDREMISWVTSSRGIDGGLIRDLMTESIEQRFGEVHKLPHRIQWLSDNGPCYVAKQTVFYGKSLGFEICTTAPYSPESNGMAEAFVKTFKRDYVYINDLSSAQKVREQLEHWFEDYNNEAPHKALKMMPPTKYRESLEKKVSNL